VQKYPFYKSNKNSFQEFDVSYISIMQMQTLSNQKAIEAPGAKNIGGSFGNFLKTLKVTETKYRV
jgi:hypothetical protein